MTDLDLPSLIGLIGAIKGLLLAVGYIIYKTFKGNASLSEAIKQEAETIKQETKTIEKLVDKLVEKEDAKKSV